MNSELFTDSQFAQLAEDVVRVLQEIGYHVGHEDLKARALRAGCTETAQGRIVFHQGQVEELRARLLAQYPPRPPEATHPRLIRPRHELQAGFGNIVPKFYNHDRRAAEGATTAHFTCLVKFAHAEPRIGSVTVPVSRQDVPPAIEQLEAVLLMARLTDKPLGAIDATVPEAVPFLAEMGKALGRDPVGFTGQCNCINPPLRLGHRTAETMLQRVPYHGASMITTMTNIGGTAPVDVYGSVVLATAEIVGGLILTMAMDPAAPLMGYTATTQLDMLTGNLTESTPQTVQVDAGVYQLMERHFGGGTRVGGRGYITARHPGLQAVFERFLKAVGYAALVDEGAISYAGSGNLDNGSVISPEQYLLDLEITEGLLSLWATPTIPPPGDAVARIREGVLEAGGNFIALDHTLRHFRSELWDPTYFGRLANTRAEAEIVARCHDDYLATLDSYRPASHPAAVVRELEQIVAAARRTLLA